MSFPSLAHNKQRLNEVIVLSLISLNMWAGRAAADNAVVSCMGSFRSIQPDGCRIDVTPLVRLIFHPPISVLLGPQYGFLLSIDISVTGVEASEEPSYNCASLVEGFYIASVLHPFPSGQNSMTTGYQNVWGLVNHNHGASSLQFQQRLHAYHVAHCDCRLLQYHH
jgi:hypothetical protein